MGMDELPEETGFPHAGLAHHRDNLAVTLAGFFERLSERLELGVPPHEAREPADRGRLKAPAYRSCPSDLVDLDRGPDPFNGDEAEGLDLNETLRQPKRCGREQDAPGGRQLLHARREVSGLPHGRVVRVQVAADGAHHHVAGVQPDPDLDIEPFASTELVTVSADCRLHPERWVAGAHRVVFVRQRRPEQRHNPIAHHLIHGAFVPMDRLHHQFEHRVEELAGFLGVAVGQQLHRALQVGEEDGHVLALSLEGSLGGKNALSEVLGGVDVG
jgi:hypothetical protein